MSLLKQCDVADINSDNYHPYATCCGKCEKFEREKPYQERLLAQHIADAKQSEIEYRKKTMKQFNAVKEVNAKPMTRQEYNDLRGWRLPADEDGSDEGYLTEDINAPANMEGWDGYISWTPKAMFDDQFYAVNRVDVCTAPQDPDHELTDDEIKRLNETGSLCDCADLPRNIFQQEFIPNERDDSDIKFDFGIAIRKLKEGKKVARKGWNGSGMFVYYVPAASYPVERNNLETMGGHFENDMVPYREYLALKTAQGDVATWAPSVSDALATDWCLA